MGLLDDYGVDLTEVSAGASWDIDDGVYEFELGEVFVQSGTDKYPDRQWLVFEYLLGDEGKKKSEWFQIPEDANDMSAREEQALSFLKTRLLTLGVPEEQTSTVGRDELIGITGTLQLKTTKGKDGNDYQNIRNLRVAAPEGDNAFEPEEKEEVKEKPTAKAKAAPRTAKAAPAVKEKAAPTAVDNPFE
jgi:hypothetical protein